jgi:hypothetical protein
MKKLASKEGIRRRIESGCKRPISDSAWDFVTAYLNRYVETELNKIIVYLKKNSSKDSISRSEISLVLSLLEKKQNDEKRGEKYDRSV